jgi:excinuclease ABC subunit B
MAAAMDETDRRRAKQSAYNEKHGIVPRTVTKSLDEIRDATSVADADYVADDAFGLPLDGAVSPERMIAALTTEMLAAAEGLEFEKAASIRDRIDELQAQIEVAETAPETANETREGS